MLLEQLESFRASLCASRSVQDYLAGRGLCRETIDEMEIGYCNDRDHRFNGRVIFPIFNVACDLIAFGGRTIADSPDKYINSPESPLYCKSKVLYNLDKAQDHILESGYAIVVEGYFDVAVLWEYGIRNVVSTCGTAMTKYQLRLLKRYADSVTICYDGDQAGSRAAARAVENLADERFPLKTVLLPNGMDPDEFVSQYGGVDFMRLVNG